MFNPIQRYFPKLHRLLAINSNTEVSFDTGINTQFSPEPFDIDSIDSPIALKRLHDASNSLTDEQKPLSVLKPVAPRKAVPIADLLNQAHEFLGSGELPEAIDRYRHILQIDPTCGTVYQYLAEALNQQGELEAAAVCYRQAIELSMQEAVSLKLQSSLVQTDLVQIRDEEEEESEDEADEEMSWFEAASFHLQQGEALYNLGDWTETIAACEQVAHQIEPQLIVAYLTAAKALQQQNDLNAAAALYLKAIAIQPTAEAHARLGSLYAQQNRLTDAALQYQEAIALDPQFAGAYWKLAAVLQQSGEAEQALVCRYRALQQLPPWASAMEFAKLAIELRQHGELEWAIDCYQQAIRLNPALAEAYHGLGETLEQQGDWQAAIVQHRQAVLQQPETVQFQLGLGLALLQQAQWDEAVQCFESVTQLEPKNLQGYQGLGQALGKLDRWTEALSCYQQLADLQPNSGKAFHDLGDTLSHLQQWQAAATAFQRAIALQPDFSWSRNNLGDALIQLGQWQAAATAFQQAIALNPDFHWSHYNLGEALAKLEDWDGAIGGYRRALELASDTPFLYQKLGYASYRRAKIDLANAFQYCQHAIQLNPDDVQNYHLALEIQPRNTDLYMGLGKALARQGRLDDALITYQVASQVHPSLSPVQTHQANHTYLTSQQSDSSDELNLKRENCLRIGDNLFNQQMWGKAVIAYKEAIELDPHCVWAYYNSARAFTCLNKLEDAIASYYQAIEVEPSFSEAYFALGDLLFNQKKYSDSEKIYLQAVALNPQSSWAHYNLSQALTQIGKFDQAIQALYEVIHIEPSFTRAYFDLGRVLSNFQRWQEVADTYRKAIDLGLASQELYILLAEALTETCKWDDAIQVYSQALQEMPHVSEIHEGLADALWKKAGAESHKLDTSELTKIADYYNQAIHLKPSQLRLYHKLVSIQPYNAEYHSKLGMRLEGEGRYEGAMLAYHTAKQLQPDKLDFSLKILRTLEHVSKDTRLHVVDEVLTRSHLKQNLVLPDNDSPLVSIIIPVFNKVGYTLNCLKSLANYLEKDIPVEIIVVDDGSTDCTKDFLALITGLKFVQNSTNIGFIKTCNHGASLAKGQFLCFLNNDTEICSNWLGSLLQTALSSEQIGAVGSKLIYPNGLLQEAGAVIWADGSGWNYGRMETPDAPEFNFLRSVDYCSAASLIVRKDAFDALGGFNENFAPAYYEDTDLCFGLRNKLNLKVLYQPKSQVIHFEGISSGISTSSGVKRYQCINAAKFAEKWKSELSHHLPAGNPLSPFLAPRRLIGQKTILFIEHSVPCYDKESGYRRLHEIIKIFKELGFHVIFAPDDGVKHDLYTTELQDLGVEVLYFNERYNVFIEEQLKRILPLVDIAWICRPSLNQKYAYLVRTHNPQAKLIYDTIDLHYVRLKRAWELMPDSSTEKPLLEEEWKGTQQHELSMARYADVTVTVTSVEKEILQQQSISEVAVIPNIHSPYTGKKKSFEERQGILFIGGYKHIPNIDAVQWLCQSIMPIVWRYLPHVTVTLLGSNPPDEVISLAEKRILVPGYVRDVTQYFVGSKVFVAPLRYGAGMKGKIGQSMEYGLPVISTMVGVEGMNLIDEHNVLTADESEHFASQIVRLYTSKMTWEKLAGNTKEAIAPYTPEQVKVGLDQLMRTIGVV